MTGIPESFKMLLFPLLCQKEAVFRMGDAGLVAVEKSVLQFPKKDINGDAFVVGPAKKIRQKRRAYDARPYSNGKEL
jgi:hypothetical protein